MRISIAVIVIAVFASVTPAEAHCTWRHPGHCLKGGVQDLGKIAAKSVDVLGKGTEVIVKEIPVVGAPAAEIIGAVREDVVEVIEETPVTVIEETGEVPRGIRRGRRRRLSRELAARRAWTISMISAQSSERSEWPWDQ